MILSCILHTTRVAGHYKSLQDTNHISEEAISGNLTSTISDHLSQFFIVPSIFFRYFFIKIQCLNHSFDNFLLNINEQLDKHVLFKKVSKYPLKLKMKPLITGAIHKSVLVKNALFKKYIKGCVCCIFACLFCMSKREHL